MTRVGTRRAGDAAMSILVNRMTDLGTDRGAHQRVRPAS